VVDPVEKTEPGVCDLVQTRLPAIVQLSAAVGSVQVTLLVHPEVGSGVVVILAGQLLRTGF